MIKIEVSAYKQKKPQLTLHRVIVVAYLKYKCFLTTKYIIHFVLHCKCSNNAHVGGVNHVSYNG